ncbi:MULTISPECIES: 5'/3'-nucleotidase SurE [Salinivibrio]|uniref:5'-nucleotidase SurE n=1 Tax=Salinivibrio costicola subsp. alcaliphilus TaxID=272773 RepID=A0ABX3KTU2_SALCS|nr:MULTISPECIES: 5'/3'-nucleotidase SurE [Salinivibrio]NUY57104.1 5'/3'-nucleotidase SurE [Salinivibrio sp. EAGSL]OOE94191.1 5'/3'-nucleotidase SurE [Salinivibrio sp. AR647]OOE94619.1 5'/3'-nucleotidase SurE [Salinivibrio sp. AR640]OOE98310.1 5'/3'-nucleotidase SurE [Salinivibrio sp. IB643]OOF05416.1 5'/3'-nucleotidase SurE [Salinivibrio sp. MA607]
MRILISNDDGYHAQGIQTLTEVLSSIADVVVAAPDRNCSGASNSLTLENPLRVRELGPQRYAVQGTPTDSVHLALRELLPWEPDFVITGINHGANLGDDVLYSGTVAAATEGFFLGAPAIAVSLCGHQHFDTAAHVVKQFLAKNQRHEAPNHRLININVPDVPLDRLAGWKVTRLGARHHAEDVIKQGDPRGKPIYWIGAPGKTQDAGPGTDFHAISEQFVSITPLQVDLTAHDTLGVFSQWLTE